MSTQVSLASLIDPTSTVFLPDTSKPSARVSININGEHYVKMEPKPPTRCERFCGELRKVGGDVLGALWDIIAYIGINILLGLAAGFTFPSITAPIIVCLGAALATAFVVKFLDRHDFKCLSGIKMATSEFRNKHRNLTIITFVVSFILFLVAPLTPVIMYVSASLLGILQGFIAQVGMAEKNVEGKLRTAHDRIISPNSISRS